MVSVFVSYSHKDADFARQLVDDIRSRVGSVWFDEVSIRPGRYWDDEIEKGIREADVLLSLLSPNLLASKICKDEFDNADRLGKPVIPILVQQCSEEEMWMRMARRQWIDFRTDYSQGLSKLFSGLSHLGEYAVPLTQKCLICEKENTSDTNYCPNCKAPYVPSQLGEIYTFSSKYLQKYLNFYRPRTQIENAGVEDLIAVSVVLLILRSYENARNYLERVTRIDPTHSYAWYLLGIAKLAGQRPRTLKRSTALDIQNTVQKAVNQDMMLSQAFLLLALLKDDYFKNKGFKIDRPTIPECIERANRGILDRDEIRALLNMVSIPQNKLIQAIRVVVN